MQTRQRTELSRNTIAIDDAIALLATKFGEVAEARRVFVERAQIGDILTIAARAYGPFDGDCIDESDWEIPADLWQRLGSHSDNEWQRGDLTAALSTDRYAELEEYAGTPLRLIGVRVHVESINRILDALPIEWVKAHDAIEMLLPSFGRGRGPTVAKALAKRAHSGLVKSRARLFKWEEPKGGAYGRNQKVEREAQFALLPKQFWWAEGNESLRQNWVSGDFATWIDRKYHWQAFGTEFARSDIEAMLPTQSANAIEEVNRQKLEASEARADVANSLPGDELIAAKILELVGLGMTRDVAAKVIRQVAGFEGVGNEHARRTVSGLLPRGRRKKGA